MINYIDEALSAERETAEIEFKESMDATSAGDWCEVVKDIVAMANSGGGVIVFGLHNDGSPSGSDVTAILGLDSATVTDKVNKYANHQFSGFSIQRCEKSGNVLAAMKISPSNLPMVFERPGTYDIGGGKQKNVFGVGTVYFRHGAKSEPGNSEDLRKSFDRQLERVREGWLANVRQVVEAPLGSAVFMVSASSDPNALPVRISDDPNAPIIGGISPDRTHPYRQKELIDALNVELPPGVKVNQYDIQCVRKQFDIESKLAFHYHPKFGGHQYSPAFASWILKQYLDDPNFFQKTRQQTHDVRRSRKLDGA